MRYGGALGEVRRMRRWQHHHRHLAGACARHHLIAIGIELVGVQVAVGVDQHGLLGLLGRVRINTGRRQTGRIEGKSTLRLLRSPPQIRQHPMPRKFFKRYMPNADKVREVRIMGLFGNALFHPALWHLNRRSAAGGIATGLFCGLIPARCRCWAPA
jgi:hypothetical protein